MFRYLLALLVGLYATIPVVCGDEGNPSPMVVYQLKGDFDAIKEDLELAITARGLLISGTLHISDMLKRTGEDLGYPEPVFQRAESIEFCSALISHLLVRADPTNSVVCPFTSAIYVPIDDRDYVYVAFHRPSLMGKGEKVTEKIVELMDGIVREAIE